MFAQEWQPPSPPFSHMRVQTGSDYYRMGMIRQFVQSSLNTMHELVHTEWKPGVLTVNSYIRECGGKCA